METALFVGLFLILAFTLYIKAGTLRFPGVIAVLIYGALYVWNRDGVLRFSYDFEARHAAYLLLTLFIFGSSALVAMRSSRRARNAQTASPSEKQVAFVTRILMITGIVGALLWAFDMLRSQGGLSGLLSSNLNVIRQNFAEREVGIGGQIGSVLSGCAVPGLVLGLHQWLAASSRLTRRLLTPLLIGLLATMGMVAVLSGGRQAVWAILLCIAAVVLYGGWRSFSRKRRRIFMLSGCLVIMSSIGYFVLVANQRAVHGSLTEDYLLFIWDAKLSDWYSENVRPAIPQDVSDFIVTLHGYFPYNLTGLAVWQDGIQSDNLGWGRWQGEHILRQFRRLGLNINYDLTIENPPDFHGTINWPTVIGSQIADFGLLGALVVTGWWGWLLGIQFGNHYYHKNVIGYLFTSIGLVYIVFGVMYSPFQETLLLYGSIWSLLTARFLRSQRQRANVKMSVSHTSLSSQQNSGCAT